MYDVCRMLYLAVGYIKRFRYCEYLGKYFCNCCHSNKLSVIPAKILHRWDFNKVFYFPNLALCIHYGFQASLSITHCRYMMTSVLLLVWILPWYWYFKICMYIFVVLFLWCVRHTYTCAVWGLFCCIYYNRITLCCYITCPHTVPEYVVAVAVVRRF